MGQELVAVGGERLGGMNDSWQVLVCEMERKKRWWLKK
jgi:hypothetical protein